MHHETAKRKHERRLGDERIYEHGRKIVEDAGSLVERSRRHYESLLR
jgi:hypothetical protein